MLLSVAPQLLVKWQNRTKNADIQQFLFAELLSEVERSTDGSTKFRVFRYVETHVVELFQHRINLFALGVERQIAYQYKVFDARVEGGKNARRTDALQYHGDNAKGNIFAWRVILCLAE